MKIQNKTCLGCDKTKPITEYHNHPTGKYGVKARCKLCYNLDIVGANAKDEKNIISMRALYYKVNGLLDKMVKS